MDMIMNMKRYIAAVAVVLLAVGCDRSGELIEFEIDRTKIEISEVGGTELVQLSSGDDWIASTDNTWITVSPANGRGSTPCKIIIDSALTASPRTGVVRIENTRTWKSQDIVVEQRGYPYTIEIDENAIEVANFEAYGKRYFDVRVRSNVDFEVDVPDNAGWLTNESYRLNLNRGVRPREVTVRFNWDINTSPRERLAEVVFRPKSGVEMTRQDALNVRQLASEPIVENSREGDSVALLSIARAMGVYTMWDASTPMSTWDNVTLWEEQMEGCTPDKVGRVRKVEIMLFHT
ncbi:MAG: BACON domain-containing protein, partial [Rikenellaceae bacterium]|nr:BACON domain-containing protein [Rikenellaceae bacterium]